MASTKSSSIAKAAKPSSHAKLVQPTRVKKAIPPRQRLPNVLDLSQTAGAQLWRHKRLFLTIAIVYGVLNLLLVQGLSNGKDIASLKQELNALFSGNLGSLTSGLTVFVVLAGSAGNGSSNTAGAYQFILVVMASLAIIWALRETVAGKVIRARDAYYRGMYPLVPFMLVLLVVVLQLLPLIVGASLYSLVITNGIAVAGIEKLLWGLAALALAAVSLYLICSSIFALYVVTLPNMTPLKALRSARKLAKHHRWELIRKLLFLPVLLLLLSALIMLPIIIWLTPLAQWVFFILTMLGLLVIHSYLYSLYRELLND